MQYTNHMIMSSGKDKDNVKQKVARNYYQTLINEPEKTNENDQQNFIIKLVYEIMNKWPHLEKKSFS